VKSGRAILALVMTEELTISTYALRVNEARKKEKNRRISSGRASN